MDQVTLPILAELSVCCQEPAGSLWPQAWRFGAWACWDGQPHKSRLKGDEFIREVLGNERAGEFAVEQRGAAEGGGWPSAVGW